MVGQDGSTTGSTGPTATTIASTTTPSTSTSTTSTGTGTTGTTTLGPSDTSAIADEGFTYIQAPDGADGPGLVECDVWAQDCPEGEKCMPWANDGGGSWNALRCSPIDPMPHAPGEACTVEGSGVSGIDSCEGAAMCWDVDPETNAGTCVAFCTGSRQDPTCAEAGTHCVIANDGVLILCLPCCDPRAQSCVEGEVCVPFEHAFVCTPDDAVADALTGEPCTTLTECSAGVCAGADAVPGCTGASCCTPWCTLGDDAACAAALPGTVCSPWLAEGTRPSGCGNVALGYCALPS